MGVSTGTLTIKKNAINVAQDKFILTATIVATGDASGGTIDVTKDLRDYFPTNCRVTIIDANYTHNAASSVQYSISMTSSEWEFGNSNILGYVAGATVVDYQDYYYSTPNSHTTKLPLFIGKPIGSTLNMRNACKTNTDTKIYGATLRFLIEMLKE